MFDIERVITLPITDFVDAVVPTRIQVDRVSKAALILRAEELPPG
jgi:hypothetical protein